MTDNFNDGQENHDEFIEPENGAPESQKRGMGGNLAEAWRTRPMFKFMVLIVAIFAVGVAGFSFFGGSGSNSESARLGKPPVMKEAPGGAASPYMRQQTELANKERSEQAIENGGSALPTPIGQNADVSGFGSGDKKDDTLNELRAETEQLKAQVQQQQVQQAQQKQIVQQQVQQQQQLQQQTQHQSEQFDSSLAEAMQHQMQELLESWKPQGMKQVDVIKAADLKAEQDKANQAERATSSGNTVLASQEAEQRKIVVNAGTVSYAQLLTEANSDVPGPILATIVSGPLAGARAVGTFQVSDGYEKYLVLKFSLADQKGKDYSINAVALDPNTTLGGMATEVDERYFVRVVLPAAAGFLQGVGQGASEGNSTVTTNGTTTTTTIAGNSVKYGIYNGLGQAAQTMGQFFQNQANLTKPLVRVAAGTPIGMFFIQPVTEPNNSGSAEAQQNNGNGNGNGNGMGVGMGNGNNYGAGGYGMGTNGNGMNMGNGMGYPGTTVNGYGNNANGNNSIAASAAAAGMPYPNYAVPGYGYSGINRSSGGAAGIGASPYAPN